MRRMDWHKRIDQVHQISTSRNDIRDAVILKINSAIFLFICVQCAAEIRRIPHRQIILFHCHNLLQIN